MASPRIAGIFEDPIAAEREGKLSMPASRICRIVVSAPANDSIAPQWRSATRVVTVAARSEVEKERIARLMLSSGARDTVTPP